MREGISLGAPYNVELTKKNLIGEKGEAQVHDISLGKVCKVFKDPDDESYIGDEEMQVAAQERIEEYQTKLPELLDNLSPLLPDRVVTPEDLVVDKKSNLIAGHIMRNVKPAEELSKYGDWAYRSDNKISNNEITPIFRDLRKTVSQIHHVGAVIGDFNDTNVLVQTQVPYIIDSDSFQFGKYLNRGFHPDFVDPLLLDNQVRYLKLDDNARKSPDSDWYAYNVMLFKSLLFVLPYDGTLNDPNLSEEDRIFKRLTVFNGKVTYPADDVIHFDSLPDDLADYFYQVFEESKREPFPENLLKPEWKTCFCGTEHARDKCPNPHTKSSPQTQTQQATTQTPPPPPPPIIFGTTTQHLPPTTPRHLPNPNIPLPTYLTKQGFFRRHWKGITAAGLVATAYLAIAPKFAEDKKPQSIKNPSETPTTAFIPEQHPNLSPSEAMRVNEEKAWSQFLGSHVDIPSPPQQLLDVLGNSNSKGFNFEPHYIPTTTFSKDTSYPGWHSKPMDQFWTDIGTTSETIGGNWILIDTTKKTYDSHGDPSYSADPFSNMIADLRKSGKIISLGEGSRVYVTRKEIYQYFNPTLALTLGINSDMVRLPKALEYNMLGNIFHPEWGEGNMEERFDEKRVYDSRNGDPNGCCVYDLSFYGSKNELGTNVHDFGLSIIESGPDQGKYDIGFRPIIIFPLSTQKTADTSTTTQPVSTTTKPPEQPIQTAPTTNAPYDKTLIWVSAGTIGHVPDGACVDIPNVSDDQLGRTLLMLPGEAIQISRNADHRRFFIKPGMGGGDVFGPAMAYDIKGNRNACPPRQ